MRTTVALALFALLLCTAVVHSQNTPAPKACSDCNGRGHVVSSSPCLCQCQMGTLPPSCKYTDAEAVKLVVLVNVPLAQFTSKAVIPRMATGNGFPEDTDKLYFEQATASGDRTVMRLQLRILASEGDVHRIQRDMTNAVNLNEPWVQDTKIISLGVDNSVKVTEAISRMVAFQAGPYTVYAWNLFWVVLVILLILVLLFTELVSGSHMPETAALARRGTIVVQSDDPPIVSPKNDRRKSYIGSRGGSRAGSRSGSIELEESEYVPSRGDSAESKGDDKPAVERVDSGHKMAWAEPAEQRATSWYSVPSANQRKHSMVSHGSVYQQASSASAYSSGAFAAPSLASAPSASEYDASPSPQGNGAGNELSSYQFPAEAPTPTANSAPARRKSFAGIY